MKSSSVIMFGMFLTLACIASKGQVLDKDALIRAAGGTDSQKPIAIYGKIVDQFGAGVNGVSITCHAIVYDASGGSGALEYKAMSNSEGLFQFVGLHGESASLAISMPGYAYNWRSYLDWWNSYIPDPNHPALFEIYKLSTSQPMIKARIRARATINKGETHIDLATGKSTTGPGDLVVRVTSPNTPTGPKTTPFDWTLEIQVPSGGLVPITDRYPFLAPSTGYQSDVRTTITTDQWQRGFQGYYYFSARNGTVYGRVRLSMAISERKRDVGIEGEAFSNPNSSTDLEYDKSKRIEVPGANSIGDTDYNFE